MRTVFGWPLYSDVSVSYTPTFSGGSWSGSLPLTNLQNRRLSKVARSTNALAASTQFDVNLGVARAVGVMALPKHNFTTAATVRVRGSTVSNFASTVYDSGTVAGWPAGVTAEDAVGINIPFWLCPATAQTARYWRFEVTDTANPAGYIELGRVVLAGAYVPAYAPDYGAGTGLESDTVRTVTDGGGALYDVRPIRRTHRFTIGDLAESEAFGTAWKMQRLLGTSGQFFFLWDGDDTTYKHERSFLAVLRQLSPIEYVGPSLNSTAYEIVEEL